MYKREEVRGVPLFLKAAKQPQNKAEQRMISRYTWANILIKAKTKPS